MWVCSSSAFSGVSGSAIFCEAGEEESSHTHTVHSLHHYIDQSSVYIYVNDADTTTQLCVCVCVCVCVCIVGQTKRGQHSLLFGEGGNCSQP